MSRKGPASQFFELNKGNIMTKRLSVYYFKGQDFWIRPQQFRDDMKRLKEAAVDSVYLPFHEADLRGGNLPFVADCVREAGMEVLITPSRVGALVAGWHRGVGYLSALHPELWARREDGSPVDFFGPQLSVHHPDAPEAFAETVAGLLKKSGANGLVWDELKSLDTRDHCEAALKAHGGRAPSVEEQTVATVAFFSKVNGLLRERFPELLLSLFLYGHLPEKFLVSTSQMEHLDEFGCDGMVLRSDDPGQGDDPNKKLMSGHLDRFLDAAHTDGRRSYVLVETQRLNAAGTEAMFQRLDEFFERPIDHITYYDYPHGLENPEEIQPRLAEAFKTWRLNERNPS